MTGLALLALLGLAVTQVQAVGDFRIDDAYITFSFSKNLAHGNGPIFSHGLRVEGYSNFLWMVLTAFGYLLAPNADPYLTARIFSGLALLVAGFSVYRLVRRSGSAAAGLVAVALLFSCTDLFRAAASGLETAAFAAAIVAGWCFYFSESPLDRRWSLVAFLPAALLRIDGFAPLLVVLGFEVLSAFNERRFSWLELARWAAPALGVWALYFAWRYAYYGLPLPSTYYAKQLVTSQEPTRGVNQLWAFVKDYGLVAFLPVALASLFWGPRREASALWLAVTLQVAYAVHVGGDWMPFERFFLPIVPLGAVLCGFGVDRIWRNVRSLRWAVRWPLRIGALAAVGFVAVHAHAASVDSAEERDKLGLAVHSEKHTRENLLGAADLLRWVVRRPGDRLVTDYAGVFSVYTDAQIIDMWGLCNADIALHGGIEGINPIYGRSCAECYARLDPDYFHVVVPLVRDRHAFSSQRAVIDAIFQGWAIDRVIDLQRQFVVGRVVEERTGRALWFLERKRVGRPLVPRSPSPGIGVDYPF